MASRSTDMGKAIDVARVSAKGGRSVNEDCADSLDLGRATCAVVADGLGGHRGGEVASRVAVDAVLESFRAASDPTVENVAEHIRRAHEGVLEHQRNAPAMAQMRSTIAVLVAGGAQATWGHVGDARVYRVREGQVVARTKDHSVSQALVDAGEVAPHEQGQHEDRSRLLRSLGKEGDVRAAIHPVEQLRAGDGFLLCTDGFWEVLSDTEIAIDFCGSSTAVGWIERLEGRVTRRMASNKDNYTAIALRVTPAAFPEGPAVPERVRDRGPTVAASVQPLRGNRFVPALLLLILVGVLAVWTAPTVARTVSAWRRQTAPGIRLRKQGGEPAQTMPTRGSATELAPDDRFGVASQSIGEIVAVWSAGMRS